jgi:hypothetical protein
MYKLLDEQFYTTSSKRHAIADGMRVYIAEDFVEKKPITANLELHKSPKPQEVVL